MSYESERIGLDSMVDIQAAAAADLVTELGLEARTVGSAFVSIAAKAPATAIVINRALGLGLWHPETRESVEPIVAAYRVAGVERYFIRVHPSATPAEIDWFVRNNTVNRFGPVREVVHEPACGLVQEVAFEGLHRSTQHKSGIAMRSPRISRLRWDKPPAPERQSHVDLTRSRSRFSTLYREMRRSVVSRSARLHSRYNQV